jgi:hypothetical protein
MLGIAAWEASAIITVGVKETGWLPTNLEES